MNRDTKERIKYYRDYLPKMKEKLFGAALMFIISALMMSSATFAWITLSASPQVMSIDTTVAANGNLEIALSQPDGTAPGKSQAGDSFAAEGTPVTRANRTWGNLINLTDPSYGLSNVTLRPAALKGESGLLSSPLFGVGYGADGRAEQMTTADDFAYVYFDNAKGEFMADLKANHLGVRAVSTVQYVDLDSGNVFSEYKRSVERAVNESKSTYASITSHTQSPGKEYVASLQGLIQAYAQATISGGLNDMDITEYVPALYKMMSEFDSTIMEKCGAAYLDMAHMLHYKKNGPDVPFTYTVDTLCNDAVANKLPTYIEIEYLKEFAQDRKQLKTYLLGTEETFPNFTAAQKSNNFAYHAWSANNGGKVYWKDLSGAINWLVKIDTCVVDGYPMSSLKSNAMSIVGNKTHTAVIKEGALYRAEQRLGQKMSPVISITIDASSMSALIGKKTLNNITVSTAAADTADNPYRMPYDLQATLDQCGGAVRGNDAIAEDTYAMAIDFWLRTNAGTRGIEPEVTTTEGVDEDGNPITTTVTKTAAIPFVTLEGSIRTEKTEVDVKVKDINGNEQPAYTLSATIDGEELSVSGYKRGDKYYYIDPEVGEVDLSALAAENGVSISATPQKEIVTKIIGYDGVNRVWTDDQMAEFAGEGTSTTQGGGSCYVFYANNESDQKRFLDLLSAMHVVFIDGNGRKIGGAVMDTENYFAQNGKVTVPLAIEKNGDNYLGMDINARDIYSICQLERGVAKRITALVYLDGTKLSNDMVLASGDIQGTLNIQFSSVEASKITTTTTDAEGNVISSTVTYELGESSLSIKNDKLMDDRITVSADATVKSFEYDPAKDAKTTVEVTVGGVDPSSVKASFIRAVNSTQGSLQDMFEFDEKNGKWTAEYVFTKPGTYILRSVWIDGAEYDLTEPVTVVVTGMVVRSLTCDAITDGGRSASIFTAAASFTTKIKFGFADSKGVPGSVNGIFLDEAGNEINVTMKVGTNGTDWSGSAKFNSSGRYIMKYYTVDGDLYELPESMWITLDIQLGLKVQTWISCDDETLRKLQEGNPNATANSFKLMPGDKVTLEISAKIFDNNGNSIDGLTNVEILYGRAGSAMEDKGLDADLKWDADRGRYVGSFLVGEAGAYRFTRVEVGPNSITSYISAPTIQAMPPENVSYYNNGTLDYQFAPKKDAEMILGLAFSSAATKIEAAVTNGSVIQTIEGVLGNELEGTGDAVVNNWHFKIPEVNGTQEGQWTLRSITLYGVYYDDIFYGDEEGAFGVTMDLAAENIHTKVVNNIHVTLNSSTASKELTGYFMDEQKVSGNTVVIADYEGQAIQGLNVSDVKVMYTLDYAKVSLATYGYTANGLEGITVSAAGTLKSGSSTDYNLSALSFRYAGAYNKCDISFAYNGKTYTAGTTEGTVLHYRNAGSPADSFPVYDVKWIAPTVKITGTNPDPSSKFNINLAGGTSKDFHETHNYYEDYFANVYHSATSGLVSATYTAPKMTLTLSNAGSNFTNTVFRTVITVSGAEKNNTFTFTKDNSSVTGQIGGIGDNLSASGSNTRYSVSGKAITTVDMTYGGKTFTVNLSNGVTIQQGNALLGSFAYNIGAEYDDIIDVDAEYAKIMADAVAKGVSVVKTNNGIESNDARTFSVTLPSATVTKIVSVPVGDSVITYRYTEITQPIKWTTTSSGGGCGGGSTTENHTGSKVTTIKETISTGEIADFERTYKIDKWSIDTITVATGAVSGTTQVNPGTVRNIGTVSRQVATPIVSYVDGDQIGEPHVGSSVTATEETVVWKEGNSTISEPSGWSNNGNATTRTWEE